MKALSLLLSLVSNIAQITKNKALTTLFVVLTLGLGIGSYYLFQMDGFFVYLGVVFIATLILSGINKSSPSNEKESRNNPPSKNSTYNPSFPTRTSNPKLKKRNQKVD
jgi:hypothetical protein